MAGPRHTGKEHCPCCRGHGPHPYALSIHVPYMPKAYCKLARCFPECYLCSGGLLSYSGQARRDHSDSPEGQASAVQDKHPNSLAAGGTARSGLRSFPAASIALFPVSTLHKDSMLVSVPRRLAQDCARKPWGHLKETSIKVHSLKTGS